MMNEEMLSWPSQNQPRERATAEYAKYAESRGAGRVFPARLRTLDFGPWTWDSNRTSGRHGNSGSPRPNYGLTRFRAAVRMQRSAGVGGREAEGLPVRPTNSRADEVVLHFKHVWFVSGAEVAF